MAEWVIVGRIVGFFGVQGWAKVFSYTRERAGILGYNPWFVKVHGQWQEMELEDSRLHGKGIVVKFAGFDDRDAIARFLDCDLAVRRAQLPTLEEGEYYWNDLLGLRVLTLDRIELGVVERLFETGANDVLVVRGEREHLVPFLLPEVITDIDLEQGIMRVDWDSEF